MNEQEHGEGLKVVDAFDLDDELRSLLRPGEMVRDPRGRRHRLPRYFYEIPSYEAAMDSRLSAHFGLNEFIRVDVKEAARIQLYPRYIPCAVRVLAFYLERLRDAIGLSLHITVNGGYRSPGHRMAESATPHMWGTAADLYRIGNMILNERELIEKFNRVAQELGGELWVMPWGHDSGRADDHLHLDLGYLTFVPREISEDRMEVPQIKPRYAFEERRNADRRTPRPEAPAEPAEQSADSPAE